MRNGGGLLVSDYAVAVNSMSAGAGLGVAERQNSDQILLKAKIGHYMGFAN